MSDSKTAVAATDAEPAAGSAASPCQNDDMDGNGAGDGCVPTNFPSKAQLLEHIRTRLAPQLEVEHEMPLEIPGAADSEAARAAYATQMLLLQGRQRDRIDADVAARAETARAAYAHAVRELMLAEQTATRSRVTVAVEALSGNASLRQKIKAAARASPNPKDRVHLYKQLCDAVYTLVMDSCDDEGSDDGNESWR